MNENAPQTDREPTQISQNLLQRVFEHVLSHNEIELDLPALYNVLFQCLKVRRNCLTPLQYDTIPYLLLHTLNDWPGWKKLHQRPQKEAKVSYEHFKEFVIFRINYILNCDYQKALYLLDKQHDDAKESTITIDCSTQTNPSLRPSTAPFYLVVKGPARLLNTLIFTNNDRSARNSVVMQEYRTHANWNQVLHMECFLNLPFVEVEFQSPHLHFKTTNATAFERFVTLNLASVSPPDSHNIVEEINVINRRMERKAYTLRAFRTYCDKYIDSLKQNEVYFAVHIAIEILLNNFVADIERMNKNSLATNTSVLFKLSEQTYYRNRSTKTSDNCENVVHFLEYVTPKIRLSLYKFTGIVNGKLATFDKETDHSITYRCTHCKINYKRLHLLRSHFKTFHVVEQSLICLKCKEDLAFDDLMQNRWFHRCAD